MAILRERHAGPAVSVEEFAALEVAPEVPSGTVLSGVAATGPVEP
jgi:hypothetical protein